MQSKKARAGAQFKKAPLSCLAGHCCPPLPRAPRRLPDEEKEQQNMPYYNGVRQFRRTARDGFVSRFHEAPIFGKALRTIPTGRCTAPRRAADSPDQWFDHSLRRYPAVLVGDAARGIGPLPQLGWYQRFLPPPTRQAIGRRVGAQERRASSMARGGSSVPAVGRGGRSGGSGGGGGGGVGRGGSGGGRRRSAAAEAAGGGGGGAAAVPAAAASRTAAAAVPPAPPPRGVAARPRWTR